MPHPKVKISDNSGNEVAVDTSGASNALNVKLVNSDDIDIGNVVLTNSAGNSIYVGVASTDATSIDGQFLLGTHALLSARSSASFTKGITCEDATHNALHVAISDGAGIANVDSNSNLNVILASNTGVDIGDVEVKGHATVGQFALNVRTVGGGGSGPTRLSDNDCKHADIMANISNTGIVYIGITGVSATTGIALYAGDVYSVDIENTQLLYALPTVDNEDINVVFYI